MSYLVADAHKGEGIGLFAPTDRHGPHSLDLGADGKYYVTNTGTNSIGVFDPRRRSWEASHRIPPETGAVYPHTIRVDGEGIVWFTLAGSEQVGRLDPASGRFTILTLPEVAPGGISGGTQPYGIDVDPTDGTIWYGRLFGDRIGRIDPRTLEIQEHASPVRGPRRMRFDGQGVLWVTGYSEGQLARIEPEGFRARVYDMPAFAEGHRPAPYALGVHPETQDIWINENMTDRIFRFIPGEERFIAYPVPLSGTYTRDMTFTGDGRVCTSNNPIPAPVLEGGVLEVVCIDAAYDPPAAVEQSLSRN
jgi:streptogramin lyase